MKKNKSTLIPCEPGTPQEQAIFSVTSEGLLLNNPWMEFEDSYIELLSGSGYSKITEGQRYITC
ncbi:MAG: hypothetical protein ABIQ88_23445 [Chitinophagaceae bacterium]